MEQWETVKAVQRMQDYMEAHLCEPITLNQLARAAGYSQWHATRIFKEAVGKSPFEYLRALRLSRAALLLRDGSPRIIDVAFDFVFDSHEGFTRAFTRQFGVAPGRYSRNPEPIQLFMPASVRDVYLTFNQEVQPMNNDQKTQTVFVQVVERPARQAIIKRGVRATHYFAYCEEVGCDVWGMLTSVKEALYEPIGMWLPPAMITPGTSQYVQGVEVPQDYSGKVPEGYELMALPPCKLMVFQGEPFEDSAFEEAIKELWEVMKRYDPTLYGFQWADDDGPRFQMSPMGYRGYIEGRPVRTVSG